MYIDGMVSAGITGWATDQITAVKVLLDFGIPVLVLGVGVWLWARAKWTGNGLIRSIILCGVALWALHGSGLVWARDTAGETIDTAGAAGIAHALIASLPARLGRYTPLTEPRGDVPDSGRRLS